jgi:Cu-Zn family superoxide dismutase
MKCHQMILAATGLLLTLTWIQGAQALTRKRKDRRKNAEDDDDGGEEDGKKMTAECVIEKMIAYTMVEGNIMLTQEEGEETEIQVDLMGFDASSTHGFHIHIIGDMGNNCSASGGHYNPSDQGHGAPTDTDRHVGDLGNIVADANGKVTLTMEDELVMLSGATNVIGRAFVVHSGIDDLGVNKATDAGSNSTGNAGSRMACCIIKDTTTQGSATIHISLLLLLSALLFTRL